MATGDPVARRIIFGTHVIPTYSIEGEEASVRHTEFQVSPTGTLGGKGTASIDEDQWGDGWVSFSHHKGYWEDQSDVWELQGETWDGTLGLTTGGVDLTDDTSPCKFLYIKNTGSTDVVISLIYIGSSAFVIALSEGEVFASQISTSAQLWVKTLSGTSTIEYFTET